MPKAELFIKCRGHRCDNRATGLWEVTSPTGRVSKALLCGGCGLHDVPQGLRGIRWPDGTKMNKSITGETIQTSLIKSIIAEGCPNDSAKAIGAKAWVEPQVASPIKPCAYAIKMVSSNKPFKPFVFQSLKDGGVV